MREHGLEWVHSPASLAHPLDDGSCLTLERSIATTAAQLGDDAKRYSGIFSRAASLWSDFLAAPNASTVLRDAPAIARLGAAGATSATGFLRRNFRGERTRALLGGIAAHSMLPLEKMTSTGIALALATCGHVGGWPFPRGGTQKLADALASYLRSLGGRIETGIRVTSLRQLPPARAILLDITPRQFLAIAGGQLPPRYARLLSHFRYGMAAFKMDWALSQPVPWRSPEARRAATVHLGGTLEEMAASEHAAWNGAPCAQPFIIAAQHSLFDDSRAPQGKHTLWGYCHVPNGSEADMTDAIEAQIERFAPGFRDTILARCVLPPRALNAKNANLIGGDISGGVQDLYQLLIRPTMRYWATPLDGVYLCSASTPPGAGVHGLCGHLAARVALRRMRSAAD